MSASPAPPARLEDRHYIQDTVLRWCHGVDRKDWDVVRSVFHPDAYDDHGMYKGDVDGLINWLQGRHPSIAFSMHTLCNLLIEFNGEDRALAESYVVAYQQYLPAEQADRATLIAALASTARLVATMASSRHALGAAATLCPATTRQRYHCWHLGIRTCLARSLLMFHSAKPIGCCLPRSPVGKLQLAIQ